MQLSFSKRFKKTFVKLPKKIQSKFEDRLHLFIENKNNPILKDHQLTGDLGNYRAFSITGDYRVVYRQIEKNHIKLVNIGRHGKVYG